MSEPRRRRTTERIEHSSALQNATKRRPSLASPLPPSASVPSTPLPGRSHLPVYQQPQAQHSPDPPSGTRGLMKRLLAKPAPVNLQERESGVGHETVVVVTPPQRMESLGGGQKSLDEFDKSIHALDLVGQIDISMTDLVQERRGESPPGKRQRKVLRRRPSATSKSNPSTPFPDSFDSLDQMPTPSTITTPLRFTRHSHSPSSSSPPLDSIPYYTVFGSGQVVSAGGPRDPFWDTHGASSWRADYEEEESHHPVSPAGVGLTKSLTRKLSGKFKRNESDHQLRAKASVQSLGSEIMDREPGVNKKSSPDSPGESRFWKIVKKLSVGALREKNLADADDRPPPVPPLPTNLINQLCDSPALKKAASSSALPMHKSTPNSKSPQSAPNGPRPSTTTLSSSHSSDVASSRFFNRTQSAHSSTSSLGDEMTPPLPKTPILTKTRKLQQHIIPPSELARNHSTSTNPTTMSIPVPIPVPPPSMDDDWTIVRSPSVEFEVLSLPPPPRRRGLKVGLSMNRKASVMEDRVGVIPASSMLKMVDADVKEEDDEKPAAEENNDKSTELDEENKRTGSDDQSHSPVIPSFSTTEAINSFPARRASASISPTSRSKGSPIALSPSRTTTEASTTSPQRAETTNTNTNTNTFGRVRQQLFGMNDEREREREAESEFSTSSPPRPNRRSHVQLAHLRRLSSTQFPDPRESPPRPPYYKHHRHSSGNSASPVVAATTGIVKSKSANGAPPPAPGAGSPTSASASTPHPHRRSMSLSPALPSLGLFTSRSPARSMRSLPTPPPLILHSPAPTSESSRTVPASPPPPPVPSPTTKTLHRTRSSSHTRSGFTGRKLSQVLFSSSASSTSAGSLAPSSPASFTRSRSSRPGSSSGHQRTIATLISRSISINTKNPATSAAAAASSQALMPPLPVTPRSALTDQEKAEKWNDLLDRSARAGGTLHLDAGGRVLGSDDVESVVGLE